MILEAIGNSTIEPENILSMIFYGNDKEWTINHSERGKEMTPEVFRFNINLLLFDLNPDIIINELNIVFFQYNGGVLYNMLIQIPSKTCPESYNTLRLTSKSYNILRLLVDCIKSNVDFNINLVKEKIPEELL